MLKTIKNARMAFTMLLLAMCSMSGWAEDTDKLTDEEIARRKSLLTFVDKDGVFKKFDKPYTVLTGEETKLTSGWYVALDEVVFNHPVEIEGTVNLLALAFDYTNDELNKISEVENIDDIERTGFDSPIDFKISDMRGAPAAFYGKSGTDSLCLYVRRYTTYPDRNKNFELNADIPDGQTVFNVANVVNYGWCMGSLNKYPNWLSVKTYTMYDGGLGMNDGNENVEDLCIYGGYIYSFANDQTTLNVTKSLKIEAEANKKWTKPINFQTVTINYTGKDNVVIPDAYSAYTMETLFTYNQVSLEKTYTPSDFSNLINKYAKDDAITFIQHQSFLDTSDNYAGVPGDDLLSFTMTDRTFVAGCYNTFCCPTLLDENAMNAAFGEGNWTLLALTGASYDDESLNLEFSDYSTATMGMVLNNFPYLIKLEKEVTNPSFFGYALPLRIDQMFEMGLETKFNGVEFVPTNYAPVTIGEKGDDPESILYVGANDKLYFPQSLPTQMKAFRAYFHLEPNVMSAAKRVRLNIDGDATGIESIADDAFEIAGGEWFTLQGVKLASKPSTAGIYMNNGKKVIIK